MKRGLALMLFICGLAWITSTSVPVWTSDVTLWQNAVFVNPTKPRALLNYGVALALDGRLHDATQAWALSDRAADAPFVPTWERVEIKDSVPHNFAAIAELTRR